MSSVQIPNLPASIGLTGSELLEIVQAGVSVRTNTAAVAGLANAFVPVTATGGTVARTLPSHFGDILNVLDFATIAEADAAAIAAGAALHFRQAQRYNVDANLTITSPIIIEQGAIFDIADGFTLTLNGEVSAENYQIFDTNTSGVVNGTFGAQPIRPFWWGVATNGTTKTAANDALYDAAVTAAITNGNILFGDNILIQRYSYKEYNAVGTYLWKDMVIEKPDLTGGNECIRFFGPAWGSPIYLTVDAAVKAKTVTIATGQTITAEDRYCIADTRQYTPDAGSSSGNKSEFQSVESYDSGTGVLTFLSTLQSSYATANNAAVVKMNNYQLVVGLDNCKIIGCGGTYPNQQVGFRIIRCEVMKSYILSDNTKDAGAQFELCTFKGHVDINGVDIDGDNGYPVALNGNDQPTIGRILATRARHALTGGRSSVTSFYLRTTNPITGVTQANPGVVTQVAHGMENGSLILVTGVVGMTQLNNQFFTITKINANSYSIGVNTSAYTAWSSGGTVQNAVRPRNVGGQAEDIHVKDSDAAPFDTHASFDRFTVGSVTGSMVYGNTEDGATMQGSDITIESINVTGWDNMGLFVQFYGKPADEPPSLISIGSMTVGTGGASLTSSVVFIQNLNTSGSKCNVEIGAISGTGNGGIYIQMVAGSGDVNFHAGLASVTSKLYNTAYIYNLSAAGVGTIIIDYANLRSEATDTAHYCVYGDGNTYQTANGTPGAFINILNGSLYRVQTSSNLIRARDADIQLGAQVIATFTNFKTISGSGNVYRTSRAVATA